MASFKIGNRKIGDSAEPVVIAELGINHAGSLDVAIKMVDEAIKSGVEIIKHQTHIVDDEMSYHAKNVKPGNSNQSIYKIMKDCSLSEDKEKKLMKYILQKKKIFISSPFGRAAVDRLTKFNVPAFKIGSGECNNYPFVEYIAKKKKPIILSTGMNNLKQISRTVKIFEKYKIPFALLHCTNIYPTPFNLVRLNCLEELRKKFKNAVIGLSDHTTTNHTSLAAVALGARILEKHFTDSKKRKGPDISCSMDPNDLKDLIIGSKNIFNALKGKKKHLLQERKTSKFAFGSIVAIKDIFPNEKLTKKNIFTKRPGTGYFKANDYYRLIGLKASKFIKKGEQLKKNDV